MDKPVTDTETKIPLGELVQKVARDTGVTLTAASDVADEPVAVAVKEMPARRLLEQVADLLDYRWSRRGREGAWSYEIWQDLAAKQREAALREAETMEAVKELRDGVARLVEMADLPPEKIRQIIEEGEKRSRELEELPPAQRSAIRDSPEEKERLRRLAPAAWLWSPIGRAVAKLLGRLPPEQWTALVRGQPLILSSDPKPGEVPLPEETLRSLKEAPLSYFPSWAPLPPANDSKAFRRNEEAAQEEWTRASGYQIAVSTNLDASVPWITFGLTAYATPLRDGVPVSGFWGAMATGVQVEVGGVGRFADRSLTEPDPRRQTQLEQDPVFGARKPFRPKAEARESRGEWTAPGGFWYLEELLPDVARAYGVDILSDSYWDSATVSREGVSSTEPIALFALLDRLTGRLHHWEREGNLVRIRRRDWYQARPREVPLRFVRHWQALCERTGVLPLSEQMAMLQSLTPLQWDDRAGLRFLAYEARLPWEFCGSRTALQLLAALTPDQQQALRSGKTLPMAEMTRLQRALFAEPFNQGQQYQLHARLTPYPPLDESAAGLSLSQEALLLIRERRGGLTTFQTEAAPSAPSGPRPSPNPSSGPPRKPSPARRAAPGTPRAVGPGRSPSPAASAEPISVERFPVTRMELRFQYGPGFRLSRSVMIPSLP